MFYSFCTALFRLLFLLFLSCLEIYIRTHNSPSCCCCCCTDSPHCVLCYAMCSRAPLYCTAFQRIQTRSNKSFRIVEVRIRNNKINANAQNIHRMHNRTECAHYRKKEQKYNEIETKQTKKLKARGCKKCNRKILFTCNPYWFGTFLSRCCCYCCWYCFFLFH